MVTGFDYLSRDQTLQSHWLKRFVAIVLDWLTIWVPLTIFSIIFGGHYVLPSLLSWPLLFIYSAVFEYAIGGTLGKIIMHLKAVSTVGKLSTAQAFMRNLSKIFGLFLLLDWVIGMLTDTQDPRQKWLDQMSKTSVISTDVAGGT